MITYACHFGSDALPWPYLPPGHGDRAIEKWAGGQSGFLN